MADWQENTLCVIGGMLLMLFAIGAGRMMHAIDEAWARAEQSQRELQDRHETHLRAM